MLTKGNMALPLTSPGARRAARTPWMKARIATTEQRRRGGRMVLGGPAQAITTCERWNGLSAQAHMLKQSVCYWLYRAKGLTRRALTFENVCPCKQAQCVR